MATTIVEKLHFSKICYIRWLWVYFILYIVVGQTNSLKSGFGSTVHHLKNL